MELTPDLEQIISAVESAREFNRRKALVQEFLSDYKLASRIFNDTLNDEEYLILNEFSNKYTSVDHLWNRHDTFHAVTSLLLGLKITKALEKSEYCSPLIDEHFIPVITLSLLWHDTTRAIIESSEHTLLTPWLDAKLEKLLSKYVDEHLISYEELLRIKLRSLHCIIQHNRQEKCLHLDAAVVRIGESLDCDKWRSYLVPLYKWSELLRYEQLTHVLGTLLINEVEVEYSGVEECPVLITLKIDGNSKEWRKYNWFQVQDRVKRKIESSGFAHLFEIKVLFNDGISFSYKFSPPQKLNSPDHVFSIISKSST